MVEANRTHPPSQSSRLLRDLLDRATPRARELGDVALARVLRRPRPYVERPAEPVIPIREFFGRPKVNAYSRLFKLDIQDYYFGLPLVWSQLPRRERRRVRHLVTLAVFLVSEGCVVAATVAFDDVTGYRDGSDAFNYGPDAPTRRLRRKPLLTGELTEQEAVRFGWAGVAGAAAASALSIAVARHRPGWAIGLIALSAATFVQYSFGAKLSYHGWAEVVLSGVAFGWVLGPYGLVAGDPAGFVVVQAILFGLGPMLFGIYSNTNDIEGDARVGRRTTATTLSWHRNKTFIKAASSLEALTIVGSTAIGVAPWWFPLAMLPVLGLRATQIATGLYQGEILKARNLGILTHRAAVVTMFVANMVRPRAVQAAP